MPRAYIFTSLTFLILCLNGYAAEIDSVTPRNIHLPNSLHRLDILINQRIEEGVENANSQQGESGDLDPDEFCDKEILYTELRKAIFNSLTASWGLKGYGLDKELRSLLTKESYMLPLNDSIYRDINYLEGFSLNLKELSSVVNLDGHLIGLDKIGHFFAEGYHYFELTHFDLKSLEQTLQWGRSQEEGKFGYTTTGIFSYSDLTANLNGWRFWNKILLDKKDPMKNAVARLFDRPYIKCRIQILDSIRHRKRVKAWQYNGHFTLSDYLDGAWDEGNNCNSYKDPVIEEKVTSRIKKVDRNFSCPYAADQCLKAQEKYGHFAKNVLHPSCLTVTD